jgi:cell division protein FtsZ
MSWWCAGARGVLINITGGKDLTLFDVRLPSALAPSVILSTFSLSLSSLSHTHILQVDIIASAVREEVHPDANIIFGTVFDASLSDRIRVCVIAAVRVSSC